MVKSGYPGSKAGAGVWQRIISQMPEHRNYFELFLGHGAVMQRKKPAPGFNVGCDVDPQVIAWWERRQKRRKGNRAAGFTIAQGDALRALSSIPAMQDPKTLVYLDPPYLGSTRTRLIYAHEFHTLDDHAVLLATITFLPCQIMISGYSSALYQSVLCAPRWRCMSYRTMTRGGARWESLWMNFPAGLPLHDCRFVGDGFRERERIGRKRKRWQRRFEAMPSAERQVIREALEAVGR